MAPNSDRAITEVGIGIPGPEGDHEILQFNTPIVVDKNLPYEVALARRIVELESRIDDLESELAAEQEAQRW